MSDHDMVDNEDEVTTVDLPEDLAQKLLDAKQALDEVTEHYNALRDEAIVLLRDHGPRVHARAFGGTVCAYSHYHTSRFNSAKLKREFPDLHAQFTTTSETNRLSFPKAVGT